VVSKVLKEHHILVNLQIVVHSCIEFFTL
jgi:hypothetical protein